MLVLGYLGLGDSQKCMVSGTWTAWVFEKVPGLGAVIVAE